MRMNTRPEVASEDSTVVGEFVNDEAGYLAWVHAHPAGYIANVDVAERVAQYPMVHMTSHNALMEFRHRKLHH